ncbi:MAG: class I SAM-dependent methyltransferase [Alcanivorax sp.]|nr:class I SAM-dependent methyltransferase [Alcanivorax sp.]
MDDISLAAQLRRPAGDDASAIGEKMNISNAAVNRQAIGMLGLSAPQRVLEIGPGNGAFIEEIVADTAGEATGVHYTGLDWSAAMVEEASRRNAALVRSGCVQLLHGDAAALPFSAASFERVMAVNALYFWQPPLQYLAEIRRVMTPDGLLCLAFGDKAFMRHLPFTAHGFSLYDSDDVGALLTQAGLHVVSVRRFHEHARGITGGELDKTFILMTARPA